MLAKKSEMVKFWGIKSPRVELVLTQVETCRAKKRLRAVLRRVDPVACI